MIRIGVDLGGTKIETVALNARNGKELYRLRVPTERDDYAKAVKQISGLVQACETTLGEKGTVGIGMPGCISDDTGLVKNANSVWLNGHPLKKDLEEALGSREIRMENDANCMAVSEATDGAGEGGKIVFGVIIGTGCGGGVVVDGKPVKGINGIGGEWGHNPLPYPRVYLPQGTPVASRFGAGEDHKSYAFYSSDPAWDELPGPKCYCGRHGCIEGWISGPGFKADYQRVTGKDHSTHDIITLAGDGDADALAALDRYCDRAARALAGVIDIIDPDVIVLAGGMSNVMALYDEIPKRWGRYIFSDIVHNKLKRAVHGDSSGVRGAAWLWGREAIV